MAASLGDCARACVDVDTCGFHTGVCVCVCVCVCACVRQLGAGVGTGRDGIKGR